MDIKLEIMIYRRIVGHMLKYVDRDYMNRSVRNTFYNYERPSVAELTGSVSKLK